MFADPHALDGADFAHSSQELRFRRIGMSLNLRVLVVAYTMRKTANGETIRIISARRASRQEKRAYATQN